MNARTIIQHAVSETLASLGASEVSFSVEHPDGKGHGDYASNAAFGATKALKKSPMDIAGLMAEALKKNTALTGVCDRIEPAQPGFVNFFLSPAYAKTIVSRIAKEGIKFGKSDILKKEYLNIEFVSANPTGPLTLGNGRGGFFGDVLGNVLKFAGARVDKEFYINDAGNQIKTLGESVLAAAGKVAAAPHHYQGSYIAPYANEFSAELEDGIKDPETLGRKVANAILDRGLKPALRRAGINFDRWTSEFENIREKGLVEKTLKELTAKEYTYENDGATWLKTTAFGDDKDRVIVRSQEHGGGATYVTVDIPYHIQKWKRGYTKLIDIWGADHHGDVPRLSAGLKMLGWPAPHIMLLQLVRLIENGNEVRMSKRTGMFVTLDELCNDVGVDVARFFFLARELSTHMDFDLTLAKEHSQKNPVYYVQYAHARLANILKNAKELRADAGRPDLSLLEKPEELQLLKTLLRFPELIEDISLTYELHRLPQYTMELATALHKFYDTTRVLGADPKLTRARLALVKAAKTVFGNAMTLMGVNAPDSM